MPTKTTVITMPSSRNYYKGPPNTLDYDRNSGGIKLGCFRVCTCVHLEFLISRNGILKLIEFLLSTLCNTMVIKVFMHNPATSFMVDLFLTISSGIQIIIPILLLCYVLSSRTYQLIKQSLFEVVLNSVTCFIYITAIATMTVQEKFSWMSFDLSPQTHKNNVLVALVYYGGAVAGLVHGIDGIIAFMYYRECNR